MAERGETEGGRDWRRWLAGALALAIAFTWSLGVRIVVPKHDAEFASHPAQGLLRTDPAFLYYVTSRIVEAGGRLPDDFRADPRLEWPEPTDVPAIETVGQELVVAWTWLAFEPDMPLHWWCVWVMSVCASLTVAGVYGTAWELTGRVRWAALAALLWAAMVGNYRTVGFVLIREDFAFPWIAAHFWLVLRAARVRTVASFVLAGVTLAAAAATWHASLFVLSMEAACVLAWSLRSGQNPFDVRGAWIVPATRALANFLVPALRAKHFPLSVPVQIALGLAAAASIGPRLRLSRIGYGLLVVASVALLHGASRTVALATESGTGDFMHVVELLVAKIANLGVYPDDPSSLSFDVRLLWGGPFRTADPRMFAQALLAGTVALVLAAPSGIRGWVRGEKDGVYLIVFAFTALAALATWLVERTSPLFGMVSPVLAAAWLARRRSTTAATAALALAILLHGIHQLVVLTTVPLAWYQETPHAETQAELMQWIERNVPEGEAIAADYVTSAAILAHTRRPVLQQPKYETRRSRAAIEDFCRVIYGGTTAEVARYLTERRCRWLVLNRPFVGGAAKELGGIRPSELASLRGSALWLFMSEDPREFRTPPGFELVFQSSPDRGSPPPFRVYRLR